MSTAAPCVCWHLRKGVRHHCTVTQHCAIQRCSNNRKLKVGSKGNRLLTQSVYVLQFYFTVHGPSSHLFGKDGLKVCYENEGDAQRWREALKEAISHLSTDMVGRHISTDLAQRSPSTSTFQESPLGRDRANSATSMTPVSSPGSEAFIDHSNMAKVASRMAVPHLGLPGVNPRVAYSVYNHEGWHGMQGVVYRHSSFAGALRLYDLMAAASVQRC